MSLVSEEIVQEILLSIAVTAHSEGGLLRPTLRSISAAISELARDGVSCELLIVLDNATAETSAEAEQWLAPGRVTASVRIVRSAAGDASASRNLATHYARGLYLAFCDGDDLVTSNYLQQAMLMLLEAQEPLIIHPSEVVSFGARSAIWKIPASESIDHRNLVRHNLWPSSSVSQRSTYESWPYSQLAPEGGFGPEDWLWNIETAIAGIPHRPAPETMFFYRVREFGGVNNRHVHSILPWFDLDGLIDALPLHSDPEPMTIQPTAPRSRRILRRGYRIVRPVARMVTAPLGQARREKIYSWVTRVSRPVNPAGLVSPRVEAVLREAAEIEPALSWTAYSYANLEHWNHSDDGYAALLVEIVANLKGHTEALVMVPWVGIGGADLVSINYAKALVEDERFHGNVSMLATYIPSRTIRHLVPTGVNFVQVPEKFRELSPDQQRRLMAQVLLLLKPEVIVSVNCFDLTNSLQFFGRGLSSQSDH
jgi:glycosyltransferase involved in cell wall biosynthesis